MKTFFINLWNSIKTAYKTHVWLKWASIGVAVAVAGGVTAGVVLGGDAPDGSATASSSSSVVLEDSSLSEDNSSLFEDSLSSEIVEDSSSEEDSSIEDSSSSEIVEDSSSEEDSSIEDSSSSENIEDSSSEEDSSSSADIPDENEGMSEEEARLVFMYEGDTILGLTEYGAAKYTEVVIPESINGVTITRIGQYSSIPISRGLENFENVTKLIITENITYINRYIFMWQEDLERLTEEYKGCRYLGTLDNPYYLLLLVEDEDLETYEIHTDTKWIFDEVFFSCQNRINVSLPDELERIGINTFRSSRVNEYKNGYYLGNEKNPCMALMAVIDRGVTAFEFHPDTKIIADRAFYGCDSLTNVSIPDSVRSIGCQTFYNCRSLTSVTIHDSVSSIGDYAFAFCENLTNLTIGNSVASIGDSAFAGCSSLTNVTIPDSVISIGNSAFEGCSNLTSVTIPDSVTVIGDSAFASCNSLKNVSLLNTIQFIYPNAFDGCENLQYTYYGKGKYLGNEDNPYLMLMKVEEDVLAYAIPEGTKMIAPLAFENCSALKTLTIPNSVTKIGIGAFSGCVSLTNIVIPDGVTALETGTFYNCSGLVSCTLPDGLRFIDSMAFYRCENLLTIDIPDSVTFIGAEAFAQCATLTSVGLPESLIWVGTEAFAYCESLISLQFGKEVCYLGASFAVGCESLTNLRVVEENEYYKTLQGNLYTKDGTVLLVYTNTSPNFVVPDEVTTIAPYVFVFHDDLKSITFGENVKYFGASAFEDCENLEKVYFNGTIENWCAIEFEKTPYGTGTPVCYSNPLRYAEEFYLNGELIDELVITEDMVEDSYWFTNCKAIKSLVIEDSVTTVDNNAFRGCGNITKLTCSTSVISSLSYLLGQVETIVLTSGETIRNREFENAYNLVSITIPDSVTSIGDYAFQIYNYSNKNSQLQTVIFGESSQLKSIGDCAFSGCGRLTSITIPDSVSSIGWGAFTGCSSLRYNIKDGLKYLGNENNPYVFLERATDTSITSANIENGCKIISDGVFYECSSLTSVIIPDSVTSIGNDAFHNCSNLMSVTIGNSVTSIGYRAFYNCSNLMSVTIGNSVTSIYDGAFAECSSLTSVTIPDSVTSIDDGAFAWCDRLTNVYITDIEAWCNISFGRNQSNPLSYAHNLYIDNQLVTDLIIPDTITEIKAYAFNGCWSLTGVTIPNSVTSIGESAFEDCGGLTSVYITDIEAWCNILFQGSYSNPLYYAENFYLNNELVTDLVIPDTVTQIKQHAFVGCSSLTSVTIGDSVTSISGFAFDNCRSLTSVTIGNSVTSIGGGAFNGCNSLQYNIKDGLKYLGDASNPYLYLIGATNTSITSANIENGCKIIGNSAFDKCRSLTSVTIPDSVTSIGNSAFDKCVSLASVIIPDSVTSIGNSAFNYCWSLTGVTIPNSVTSIGDYAFYNCSSLTSVTIGNSVTSIGDYVFYNCSSLTSVTIGNSVTSIGYSAFDGCSSLTSVTIGNSVSSIGDSAFYVCSSLTEIKFEGTMEQWKAITKGYYWRNDVPATKVICKDGEVAL